MDDNSRCLAGGWPGCELRKIFGVWNEEIDGITPDDEQQIEFLEDKFLAEICSAIIRDIKIEIFYQVLP